MTPDESLFTQIDKSVCAKLKLGNGELVEASGKGTIAIKTNEGKRHIRDVLLVPSLDQSLLSVGKMMQNGYSLHFEDDVCLILDLKKDNQVVAKVRMKDGRNFPITWQYPRALFTKNDDTSLWHQRFDHYNLKALRLLNQKNMIKDLPLLAQDMPIYEGCIVGKQ
ncbi:Retrovirus-related Pol polyprotein from transposon TNT 1-94 [Dendrobium catenatum]|uniref:Retrovirus-related Pol polyprotein from transposon TNT 1-94 n=1 Tax=Dendrobium catenatum TaxID=906689 RepID=A0A2I0WJS8_9ASPA|nr:Retrovirus-related Pol polyprotein from transposon TNT 1-94 [Dendrobium catenatum]